MCCNCCNWRFTMVSCISRIIKVWWLANYAVLMLLGTLPYMHSYMMRINLHQQISGQGHKVQTRLARLPATGSDNNSMSQLLEEQLEIEKIILSLSSVADDNLRRQKLSHIFEEKQQNIDGGESFMKLFDLAMITVGDRVRINAANEANAARNNILVNSDVNNNEEGVENTPSPAQPKSPLEGQLWACIDMMVQSKKLMKEARAK